MNTRKPLTIVTFVCTLVFIVLGTLPLQASGQTYTKENFLFSYHYKPVSFSLADDGSFYGTLENGSVFSQAPILSNPSVRLNKFTVDQAAFYTSDQGTFQASTNLVALSIYSYLSNA